MSRLQMRVGGEEGAGAQRQNSPNKCALHLVLSATNGAMVVSNSKLTSRVNVLHKTSPITIAPEDVRGFEPENRGPLSFLAVEGLCPV